MYQALYRKYRPQTFDDVVGQLAVTQTLKTQLETGKLSHAYLFTGSRGTGKTSSAKILAKAVNCENPINGNPCNCCAACRSIDSGACMDVLEIDAASNNGVDNVRDLRDDAVYTPSQVKMRVYIIDEVHMLSLSAFNALLKIIEEPPEHLLFILATTELHKVPATILSRCQRFSFRRIGIEDIMERLLYVAYQEKIDLDTSAARILARLADGGMRDGLSLLDQCASATEGELTAEKVYSCLGIAGLQECGNLMKHIANKDASKALSMVNRFYSEGKDMSALLDELACLCRDLLILKTAPKEGIALLSGIATDKEIAELVTRFSVGELTRNLSVIQQTVAGFTRSASKRTDTELCIVNMCRPELELNPDAMNARITKIEEQLQFGVVNVKPAQTQKEEMPVSVDKTEEIPEPEEESPQVRPDTPIGFWADLVCECRKELKAPIFGYFSTSDNAPVHGVLSGDVLMLQCINSFTAKMINNTETLELVTRKASALLGRKIRVTVSDKNVNISTQQQLNKLLQFGKEHSDIITIKD